MRPIERKGDLEKITRLWGDDSFFLHQPPQIKDGTEIIVWFFDSLSLSILHTLSFILYWEDDDAMN